jgi:RNA polymerase sigma-70 factor (ECF subfamily)
MTDFRFSDENILIRRAQRGDLDAFNSLVRAYQDAVYTLAYRIMGDAAGASDATQEAFITAYRQIKTFRGADDAHAASLRTDSPPSPHSGDGGRGGEVAAPTPFRAWLLRIAASRCYDELRRRKRRPAVSVETLGYDDDGADAATPDLPDPGVTPEQAALTSELRRAIQSCIDALPSDQRIVLVMCDVEGIDYQGIADGIGVALGTVKSRLSRARTAMRACLSAFGELLPAEFRLSR